MFSECGAIGSSFSAWRGANRRKSTWPTPDSMRSSALAVEVSCSRDALSVTLTDGRAVSVPLVWFPRLADASPQQRSEGELIGGGIGVHWEAIDEDISVASLLHPENFVTLPGKGLLPTSRAGRSRAGPGRKSAGRR